MSHLIQNFCKSCANVCYANANKYKYIHNYYVVRYRKATVAFWVLCSSFHGMINGFGCCRIPSWIALKHPHLRTTASAHVQRVDVNMTYNFEHFDFVMSSLVQEHKVQ